MAFRFEHNGRKYMQADDGTGYRVSQDAHSDRELYIEDTALVTRRLRAYQKVQFAKLAAVEATAEMEAELAAGWAEEMAHDADSAEWEAERHQAWLDERLDEEDFLARTR